MTLVASPLAATDALDDLLAALRLGPPVRVADLWLVPIHAELLPCDALLLAEALREGVTAIEEVSHAGRVDRVRVDHRGATPLLLLAGEEILGARQNRVFNASLVVAPDSSAEVPVSCVERGRWRYQPSAGRTTAFAASSHTLPGEARSGLLRRTTGSVVTRLAYDADQGQVWRDVDRHLERTQVSSVTSAYADAAAATAAKVERHLATVRPLARQLGVAAVRDDRLISVDVLAAPALFARAWPQLARGILAELDPSARARGEPVAVARRAIEAARTAGRVRRSAPGGGETIHADGAGHAVAAIVAGGRAYHVAIVAA